MHKVLVVWEKTEMVVGGISYSRHVGHESQLSSIHSDSDRPTKILPPFVVAEFQFGGDVKFRLTTRPRGLSALFFRPTNRMRKCSMVSVILSILKIEIDFVVRSRIRLV